MKKIPLTRDLYALVDDEDYEYLNQFNWFAQRNSSTNEYYAARKSKRVGGKQYMILMHKVIMGDPKDLEGRRIAIDHKNRNTLDNRRENLRVATASQNRTNSKVRSDNTSGYIGVYKDKRSGKWVARATIHGEHYSLGYHHCKHKAAQAYNEAVLKYHGDFASLNVLPERYTNNSPNTGTMLPTDHNYRGVGWDSGSGRWEAFIGVNGKKRHIGLYDCPHKAAKAYNQAAIKYRGRDALLNELHEEGSSPSHSTRTTTLSLIAAVADNGVIGRGNALPWRLPADLRYFKQHTQGKVVIMGRKTYESLGRPLPNRVNLVVSRAQPVSSDQAIWLPDLEQALSHAQALIQDSPATLDQEIMVIGGRQIYLQVLPKVDRLYLTRVHAQVSGDTYFPELDMTQWREVARETHGADERNEYACSFLQYERK